MKKIESYMSDDKFDDINKICEKEGYTKAEFNRRALEYFLDKIYNLRYTSLKDSNE